MIRSARLLLTALLLPPAAAEEKFQFRDGHPADHLPPYIRQVSAFGERPDWSADGKKLLFVEKPMGEVLELDLETGLIHPKTRHFLHYGFTRAIYLANGDILLAGPNEPFDVADKDERNEARHLCWLSVLDKSGTKPPVPLGTLAAEGPAVSRDKLRLSWTHRDYQDGEIAPKNGRHFVADIVYENGTPKLANQRLVFDSRQLPFSLGGASIETQNLVPPHDEALVFSVYVIDGGTNTDTYLVDFKTGGFQNLTRSPGHYDEPEGVYPDGKFTLVEHAPNEGGSAWPLADLYQLKLDGSGEMRRITRFAEYKGFKGTQGVVSPDGKQLCFQVGKSGDEAGVGYGFFVMDLEAAEKDFGAWENPSVEGYHPADQARDAFVTAWNAKQPLPNLAKILPDATLDDAYDVQRAWVRETVGEAGIGGVKGGFVSPAAQKLIGLDVPLAGLLRADGRYEAKNQPAISLAKYPGLKIETEIGFVIGKPLRSKPDSLEAFKEHISAVVPVIELPAGSWDAPEGGPSAVGTAAANITSAAYIVGEPVDPAAVDLKSVELAFTKDGQPVHVGKGADNWQGPWETAWWLAGFAARQGIDLQPGQIIICGALGTIPPGQPGTYQLDAGKLGKIHFTITE